MAKATASEVNVSRIRRAGSVSDRCPLFYEQCTPGAHASGSPSNRDARLFMAHVNLSRWVSAWQLARRYKLPIFPRLPDRKSRDPLLDPR